MATDHPIGPRPAHLFARTPAEIAAELERRHGWKLSRTRVQQICEVAERKLWRGLREIFEEGDRDSHP